MPFADEGRVVSRLLQVLRKEDRSARHRVLVVDDPMLVRILAGENRGPARRAQRGRDEGVTEVHPATCERVEMRRLEPGMLHEPHRIETQVIDEHEDDVARLRPGKPGQLHRARLGPHRRGG
jgi:hypothetical protein